MRWRFVPLQDNQDEKLDQINAKPMQNLLLRAEMLARVGAVLVSAALLPGCAMNDSMTGASLKRLEIQVLAPPGETDVSPTIGVAAGAAGGAMGGLMATAVGSLLCGPFFAVCFAASAPLTVGASAVVGAGMGSYRIAPDDMEKINGQLENVYQAHNLGEEVASAVSQQPPASSLLTPGVPDARLSLTGQNIQIAQLPGQKLALSISVEADLDWDLNQKKPLHTSRNFHCATPVSPVEDWLTGESAMIEREFNRCVADLALQVSNMLVAPSPKSVTGFQEEPF